MNEIDAIRKDLHTIYELHTGKDLTTETIPEYDLPGSEEMPAKLNEEIRRIGMLTGTIPQNQPMELPALVELRENKNEFTAIIELPGVKKDDVSIELRQNVVLIKARKEPNLAPEQVIAFSELRYGILTRSIPIPQTASMKNYRATFIDGVLMIQIEKEKEVEIPATKITIQ